MAIDQRIPEMEKIVKEYSVSHGGWVEKGGRWEPKHCVPTAKVNIYVLYINYTGVQNS